MSAVDRCLPGRRLAVVATAWSYSHIRAFVSLAPSLFFAVLCGFSCSFGWKPTLTDQFILGWPLVVLIGLAHGADDHYHLAHHLSFTSNPNVVNAGNNRSLILCAVMYLLVVVATYLIWCIQPQVLFVLFIVFSSLHFGESHSKTILTCNWLERAQDLDLKFASGGIPVFVSFLMHKQEVVQVFELLGFGKNICASQLEHCIFLLSTIWMCSLIIAALLLPTLIVEYSWSIAFQKAFELVSCTILFSALGPIIAFALYFSCFHSIQAMVNHAYFYDEKSFCNGAITFFENCRVPLALTVLASVACLLFNSKIALEQILCRSMFVGLACLTAPHLITHSRLFSSLCALRNKL